MKISAVICEYNPFHNGHLYQLETAKKLIGHDAVVGIMSGNFVQRGTPAIIPKSTRAAVAIKNGVDLVLELPAVLTLQSAERYARNAISTLNAIGVIDTLFFGAECPDTDALMGIAGVLANEDFTYKHALRTHLDAGLSFAAARSNAIRDVIGSASAEILKTPNNILAVEYCKALIQTNSNITPYAIHRKAVDHDSTDFVDNFASATAIRELIKSGSDISDYVPQNTIELYNKSALFSIDKMGKALISHLCLMSTEELSNIADVSEGLENPLKRGAYLYSSLDEVLDSVKSKRYAYSRLRRIVLSAYLGITKQDTTLTPSYIRILDFNETGRTILNLSKKTATLPLAKNAGQIKDFPDAFKLWQRELIIDRIYKLFLD